MKKKIKYESEINFKEAVKNPIRLFGLVFIYIFMVSLGIGIYYIWNLDYVTFNRVPGTPLDTLFKVREVERKVGANQPAMDLALVKSPTKEMIELGKEEFDKVCSACHGTGGNGDGPGGAALNPKPRDFHQKDGWTNGRDIVNMFKTVQTGVPGTGMVAYEYLSPQVKIGLIHYIRSMADYPAVTDEQIAQLDNEYGLSKEVKEASHIPIKTAISKISSEFDDLKKSIEKAVSENENDEGLEILRRYSKDSGTTLSVFVKEFEGNETLDDFISGVSYIPAQLHFNTNVVELDKDGWSKLYGFMLKIKKSVSS